MGDQDAYDGGRGRGDLLEKSARTPRCGECRLERFALVHQAPVSPRPESTIRKSGHPLSDKIMLAIKPLIMFEGRR